MRELKVEDYLAIYRDSSRPSSQAALRANVVRGTRQVGHAPPFLLPAVKHDSRTPEGPCRLHIRGACTCSGSLLPFSPPPPRLPFQSRELSLSPSPPSFAALRLTFVASIATSTTLRHRSSIAPQFRSNTAPPPVAPEHSEGIPRHPPPQPPSSQRGQWRPSHAQRGKRRRGRRSGPGRHHRLCTIGSAMLLLDAGEVEQPCLEWRSARPGDGRVVAGGW